MLNQKIFEIDKMIVCIKIKWANYDPFLDGLLRWTNYKPIMANGKTLCFDGKTLCYNGPQMDY